MNTLLGVLLAVAAFFLLGELILLVVLQDALNKLETDLNGYIAAKRVADQLIADQAAEITRLEANQADPADQAAIDAMTAQVTSMDGKLFV